MGLFKPLKYEREVSNPPAPREGPAPVEHPAEPLPVAGDDDGETRHVDAIW